MRVAHVERIPIPEEHHDVYREVIDMFLTHFPSGAIMVDTGSNGPCPELRVCPYRLPISGTLWAIVKHSDGRREIVDWPEQGVVVAMGFGPRTERVEGILVAD